jgi:hypothetical protein
MVTRRVITDPDHEQFFPGQSRQLYDLLPGNKEILEFTQQQGANFHCQPTGRQLTHTQMLDFLADHRPAGHLFLLSDGGRPPAGRPTGRRIYAHRLHPQCTPAPYAPVRFVWLWQRRHSYV